MELTNAEVLSWSWLYGDEMGLDFVEPPQPRKSALARTRGKK